MHKRFIILAAALLSLALLAAGCTFLSPQAKTSPTPVPTEVSVTTETAAPAETTAAPAATLGNSLKPSPTDAMPENMQVEVTVEKAGTYSTTLYTYFNGGKGMSFVSRMDVKVTHPDGTVLTGGIDKPVMGSTVELDGTKGSDRVEVTLTMKSGAVYKVYDQLVAYKTHG